MQEKFEQYSGMELSTQLVIQEALRRGIEVEVLDYEDNFIRLRQGDKVEYIKQATKTSRDTYITPLIMENKQVTKQVLREHGLAVPGGVLVKSLDEAMDYWEKFSGIDIVIKPKSTNYGEGITIMKGNRKREDYHDAVRHALGYGDSVLIENFVEGKEYRFLVIDGRVVAILHRIPANVVGDGVRSIAELVAEKNNNPLRGTGHVTPFEKIQFGHIELSCLQMQGLTPDSIPADGQTVYIRENSNVSTGGDSIDFTEDVREEYKAIAVKAVEAVGAKISGLDMIIRDIQEVPTEGNHSIIELNFNPAIYLHHYPYQGKGRNVEEHILDLLGF